MQQAAILIVEDEPVTRELLVSAFTGAGYQVNSAENGDAMWEILSHNSVDLILLDINLPGKDGLSITKNLRSKYRSDIFIILVTSRSEDIDRIIGLELGADDYVTKPFNLHELIIRVRNLLRRATKPDQNDVKTENNENTFHGWVLNKDQRRLRAQSGELVHLTNGEFLLLSAFLRRPGHVFNRNQLLEAISSREWSPDNRTIDVMINRLRHKLETNPKEPKIFLTVRGVGYQFFTSS